jgi:ABC-type glutathione transport system ATPase component
VDFYNLDVIISVGYRVKSPRGTQFRIWATQVLRQHLIEGYSLHQRRLHERGLVSDEGQAVLEVVQRYSRAWRWLLAYDEDRLAPAFAEPDGVPEALGLAEAQLAIDTLRRETGTAVLLVTHDLGVAADRAHRIVVLRHGQVQEAGETLQVLRQPHSAYARQLLADAPALSAKPVRAPLVEDGVQDWAVQVQGLRQQFRVPGQEEPFLAVDGVSFQARRGSTHAIVGESGSGKTTTIRALVGLLRPTAGQFQIVGTDVTALRGEALRQLRRKVQLVYQNPFASLDPRQTVFDIVEEPLRNFDRLSAAARHQRVQDALAQVGLAAELQGRRPHALSGGQRQRVAIARALVLQPEVLVLDEAVSALDVTVQAQILRLLETLQQQLQLTYVFVTHDLSVVRQIAHTVSVLQHGKVVEQGTVEQVFLQPRSHYTRELIAAIPGTRSIDFVQSHTTNEETLGLLQPLAG